MIALVALLAAQDGSLQATGVKVGEVTDASAIVWVRRTAKSAREADGACPGAPGRVRVRHGAREDLADAKATDWAAVAETSDFAHAFRLADLRPSTTYHFASETEGGGALRGRFRTAPAPAESAEIRFTVITGQAYKDLDHADGFHLYEAMARLDPHFVVPTGDTVYYDSDPPLATTTAVARLHWQRMYSLPRHVAFHLKVPGYWEKDDHDTIWNDVWPGMRIDPRVEFTFEEGCRIFREQVPMGEKTYRTVRWGRHLQVWLVEGRDFRSPNTLRDGPEKSIWGAEQKAWLKKTVLESDATWKVLVSPTPMVGPDRTNKGDNHANPAFAAEGNEIREWIRKNVPANFFVACGDRHWQYHSVDPKTGVHEFSCGPASDRHAGGSPGENKDYHRFHRVKGGFLSATAGPDALAFRFHDVHGAVQYEKRFTR
jgi:alkaline phosphatase D